MIQERKSEMKTETFEGFVDLDTLTVLILSSGNGEK